MLRLRDIMTTDVLTVSPDVTIREAAEILSTHHIGGAPVEENGRVIGVISASDILDFMASLQSEPPEADEGLKANLLEDHTVEEAMTRAPLRTLPSTALPRDAAALMREAGIHRIPIVDNERLVGMVSSLDLAKAFTDGRIVARNANVAADTSLF